MANRRQMMKTLQQKIKDIELEIMADKILIQRNNETLQQQVWTSSALYMAIFGGFALGFLLSNDKTAEATREILKTTPKIAKELIGDAKFLLSLISS